MLRFFAPRCPRRFPTTSLDELVLDEGRSRVIFTKVDNVATTDSTPPRPSQFLVTNHLPPAPKAPSNSDLPNSSLCPPFHIHLKEDETFHVLSGCAKFLLLDQKYLTNPDSGVAKQDGQSRRLVTSGEIITIPRGQIHTFRNASSDDSLVLEFGFSPPGSPEADGSLNAKMKQFFMNTQLYRSDCATQGIPRALPQVLLFNHNADVALVPNWLLAVHARFPRLRVFIESQFAHILGRFLNFFGGVVLGRWLFGLRATYEEYHSSTLIRPTHQGAEYISSRSESSDSKDQTTLANDSDGEDEDISTRRRARATTPEWACQAWRDHSFDGQSDSWRG